MNRCPEARARLSAYVEGELSALEHRLVEGHLQTCGACRREEAQYRQALGLLRAPRALPPPGDLYAGFAAKLARQESRAHRVRLQLRYAGTAACLLLAVGAGASFLRHAVTQKAAPGAASGPAQIARGPELPAPERRSPRAGAVPPSVPTAPQSGKGLDPFDPIPPSERMEEGAPNLPKTVRLPQNEPHETIVPRIWHQPEPDRSADDARIAETNRRHGIMAAERMAGRSLAPPPVVIQPEMNERVRRGNREYLIRSASGWDANGELTLIRIHAETTTIDDEPEPESRLSEKEAGGGEN